MPKKVRIQILPAGSKWKVVEEGAKKARLTRGNFQSAITDAARTLKANETLVVAYDPKLHTIKPSAGALPADPMPRPRPKPKPRPTTDPTTTNLRHVALGPVLARVNESVDEYSRTRRLKRGVNPTDIRAHVLDTTIEIVLEDPSSAGQMLASESYLAKTVARAMKKFIDTPKKAKGKRAKGRTR